MLRRAALSLPVTRFSGIYRLTEHLLLGVSMALAAAGFLRAHLRDGPGAAPTAGVPTQMPPAGFGWWSNWDQWHYLQAALAWAGGNLDPRWHWYLPGYPLLGAAFARLTPADPFLVPDLVCLLAALWLFAGIAGRLLPAGRVVGALLFLAATAPAARAWVEPWTTSPQTVGLYGFLLVALRYLERPGRRDAFLAGFAGAAVSGFRPADAAVLLVAGAAVIWGSGASGPSGVQGRRPWPFFLSGIAVPLSVYGAAHVAVFGFAPGAYVALSRQIGFEWRLLPMRWVLLVLDPRPLLSDGQGLVGAFAWLAAGFCGMAAALAAAPRRAAHGLVIGVSAAELVLMLCYRDLHPTELWRFELFHYFVWLLPVGALYAAVLVWLLLGRRRGRAGLAAAAVVAGLLMWRPALTPTQVLATPVAGTIALPDGLPRTDMALLVPSATDWDAADNDAGTLEQAGRRSARLADLKGYPLAGGVLVVPLRPLPDAAAVFRLNPALRPDPAAAPVLLRQRIVWGLPCFVLPDRAVCDQRALLPPAGVPAEGRISLAGAATGWLGAGWSHQEAEGRWTDGPSAVLRMRLPGAGGARVTLEAHGYVPEGLPPVRVRAYANGRLVAEWAVGAAAQGWGAVIPAAAVGADRVVVLRLAIADPRRPIEHGGGADGRRLGMFVGAVVISPP